VSNLPTDADERVTRSLVTEPSTEGIGPRTAPDGADGLEAVSDHRRASYFSGGQESVAAPTNPELWTPPTIENLRDIGEASFGEPPPQPETVHGPDDRVQIQNTSAYPWRAIASLAITARDNSTWIGTGWFISPRTLITAGHCVYIKNSGVPGRDGWVKSISIMPGRNGGSLPYGAVTSTVFKSVPGWTDQGDENFDYGAIVLPVPLGSTVGVFGVGVFSDSTLLSALVNVSGYPGDKPAGTHWYDSRQVAQVNARKIYYDIDTFGGQSGAPVFRVVNGRRIGVAVHAYGGPSTNSGTRINREVYDLMRSWMG
jgi:V8-like Glu-specific endopeptidase